MTDWIKVPAQKNMSRRGDVQAVITLSPGRFHISDDFARMANITTCTRVTAFLSRDGLQLALQFHDDEQDQDACKLFKNTKSRQDAARDMSVKGLLARSSELRALVKADLAVRRLVPRCEADKWVIDLVPAFDRRANRVSDLPRSVSGIYRYLKGEEVLYIGHGNLRDRAGLAERDHWDFDAIEYSVLNDSEAEAKWETFWLDRFRQAHGAYPKYNKIGGVVKLTAPQVQSVAEQQRGIRELSERYRRSRKNNMNKGETE